MTSFKKLDHRQSTTTLVERSKMLAAKVGKIHKARIRRRTENSTCSRGVEPQFWLVSQVLRFIQKVTLPKLMLGSVNKVSAVENAASLKAGLKCMEKQKGILGSSCSKCKCWKKSIGRCLQWQKQLF